MKIKEQTIEATRSYKYNSFKVSITVSLDENDYPNEVLQDLKDKVKEEADKEYELLRLEVIKKQKEDEEYEKNRKEEERIAQQEEDKANRLEKLKSMM